MTEIPMLREDLIALQKVISDEDVDLESLKYNKDSQLLSFDALIGKQEDIRIETHDRRTLKVYPIIRRNIRFRNVVDLQSFFRKQQSGLFGVTVHQIDGETIEISGCGGKLIVTSSNPQIEVGPETETEYEWVERKLVFGIPYTKRRLRRKMASDGDMT